MQRMKALVKKYPQKGLWFEDVPEPLCGKDDVKIKIQAAIFVHVTNIASIVLALFLPKNVSAPPAISPVIPALLPD